ncbi:MAG: DUF11 domain-containing protein [Pirellulales bacterium]|nr:DUF11 domain-containing protein [Pirellulales bacterium]
MKRYMIRITALSAVVALGIVVIAQAQRTLRAREAAAPEAGAKPSAKQIAAARAALEKNAASAESAKDPFAMAREAVAADTAQPNYLAAVPSDPSVAVIPAANESIEPAQAQLPYAERHGETIHDPNVLQAVGEAELSPTPVDPLAAGSKPQTGDLPAAELHSGELQPIEPTVAAPPLSAPLEPPLAEPLGESSAAPPASDGFAPAAPAEAQQFEPALADSAPTGELAPREFSATEQPVADKYQATDPAAQPLVAATPQEAPPSMSEGTGRPGGRELEGVQGAAISIEKIAPAELQVGRNASFQVRVRNTGTAPAKDVQVFDEVPKNTRLASTTPSAEQGPNGELIWSLGRLRPGEESVVSMEVVPLAEGEIGSVAVARFTAEASARSIATRPQLTIQVNGPREVLSGQEAVLLVKVANIGTGAATGVTLLNQLPANFTHPAGSEVEYTVGTLGPNETRDIELTLTAARAGRVQNNVMAYADGNLRAEDVLEMEVLAPALDLKIDGSERRFLERQATYTLNLANPGTAAAKNIVLSAHLPEGLQFVEANNLGEFDAATRTVNWRLEELPAGESGAVTMIAMPIAEGEHLLTVDAKANQGLSAQQEQRVAVEGIAGATFQVIDASDPVEVDGETSYEIRVINQGTKAATNVRVAAILPDGMQAISAEGPTAHVVDSAQVVFEPVARLAPKADTTFVVRVKATVAGDMRLRVQLTSDEMRTPVTKEESTRVFGDE